MTEAPGLQARPANVHLHRLYVQLGVWSYLAVAATFGAAIALGFFFVFETLTGRAFSLMQMAIYFPLIGHRRTEWLLISGFSMIYVALSYFSAMRLPDSVLVRRFVSNQLFLYSWYFAIILSAIYLSLPDLLLKRELFAGLLYPALVSAEDFLIFLLLPLPAVYLQYRKRGLALFSKGEVIRIVFAAAIWAAVAFALTKLE
ncbi:MAG TPA: hypothetical protein V6D17_20645 [Candidatus Obscuribacterales bacterium]